MNLASAQLPVESQQDYTAAYSIMPPGPTVFMLTSCLNGITLYTKMAHFHLRSDDGRESIAEILLTGIKDVGEAHDRLHWEFEGILWSMTHQTKRERAETEKVIVKGAYNSKDHTGQLLVLAR
jgi:hypothetical protein